MPAEARSGRRNAIDHSGDGLAGTILKLLDSAVAPQGETSKFVGGKLRKRAAQGTSNYSKIGKYLA